MRYVTILVPEIHGPVQSFCQIVIFLGSEQNEAVFISHFEQNGEFLQRDTRPPSAQKYISEWTFRDEIKKTFGANVAFMVRQRKVCCWPPLFLWV